MCVGVWVCLHYVVVCLLAFSPFRVSHSLQKWLFEWFFNEVLSGGKNYLAAQSVSVCVCMYMLVCLATSTVSVCVCVCVRVYLVVAVYVFVYLRK